MEIPSEDTLYLSMISLTALSLEWPTEKSRDLVDQAEEWLFDILVCIDCRRA